MIRNIVTQETFPDRQTAKRIMGHAAFNKAVRNGDMEYVITTHENTDIII